MSDPLLQLRMYDPDKDHPMIMQWCVDHAHVGIPANVLPALGVVVQADGEDVAALWLYMDNSTGVCFAEHPITKGNISVKLAKQALTFAMPHAKLGEEVAAAVVLREGAACTERELRDFAAQQLADFKVPRKVVFLPEIPKGATGKLMRIGLAEKLGLSA